MRYWVVILLLTMALGLAGCPKKQASTAPANAIAPPAEVEAGRNDVRFAGKDQNLETPLITGPVDAVEHLEYRLPDLLSSPPRQLRDGETIAPYDGQYPQRWSHDVRLPDAIEMLNGGAIEETVHEEQYTLIAEFLVKGEFDEDFDRMYSEIKAAGFVVKDERDSHNPNVGRGARMSSFQLGGDDSEIMGVMILYFDYSDWSFWMVTRAKTAPLVPLSSIR